MAAQNFSAANCKENGPALEVNVCAASFSVTENDTVSLADCAATRGSQATTGRQHRKNIMARFLAAMGSFLFFEEIINDD